jgi:hypothetical protein
MSKKSTPKKKSAIKKMVSQKIKSKEAHHEKAIENVLVANFISLQKVMTNLAVKFDNLGAQISKLLELFEISAKTLAEKDIDLSKGKEDKKVVEKLDTLLDQNKIIARGLTLLHEGPSTMSMFPPQQPTSAQRPPMGVPPSSVRPTENMGGYQKSMLAKNKESPEPPMR